MKKVTLLVAAALLAAVPAFGATLMSETFTYPDGDLIVTSGGLWVVHSGGGTPIQTVAGQAFYTWPNSDDVNRAFAVQSATAKTYACFEVTVGTNTGVGTESYFAHFSDGSSFNFRARTWITAVNPPNFRFGITTSSGSLPAYGQVWPVDLILGVTYEVAIAYDATTGVSTLWVNPVGEGSPSISSSTTSSSTSPEGLQLSAFAMRQNGSGQASFTVDNIEVAQTFDEACPQPTPVETTSFGRIKALYR